MLAHFLKKHAVYLSWRWWFNSTNFNSKLEFTFQPICSQVTIEMSKILHQLVMGELQQMSKVSVNKVDRYQNYIDKTFNKTASLMAQACK